VTARAAPGPAPSWHDDAERLGAALDRASAVLVVGRDGDAAAWAALGAARAQAARRRVAVADLVGDAPALAALGEDAGDGVGISDSFFYGVSLNRIARPVDASGNLFLLPSGSEPVAVADVLSSDRWPRLAAGFRDAGALLLLAARADAPGLTVLAGAVDGLVVVGDLGGLLPDAPAPLMVVPAPSARRVRATQRPEPPITPADADPPSPADAGAAPGTPVDDASRSLDDAQPEASSSAPGVSVSARSDEPGVVPAARSTPAPADAPRPRRGVPLVLGAAIAAAVAAGVWWYARQPAPAARPARPAPTAPTAAQPRAAVVRDSAPAESVALPAIPAGLLVPANPADSARAAAYAVHLVSAETPERAALASGVDPGALPALALTPQLDNGAPWWRLFAGAYPTRQRAESLLAALQEQGVLGTGSGAVVRAPYALLVVDRLAAADAPARVEALARRGVPTYPLPRADGSVALYAGAFERPQDAEYLATALRAAGVAPVLAYRLGGR
jgi:hypothetical protein